CRARCVKGRIPRHERAVLTFKEGRMRPQSLALASTALLPPPSSWRPRPSRPRAVLRQRGCTYKIIVPIASRASLLRYATECQPLMQGASNVRLGRGRSDSSSTVARVEAFVARRHVPGATDGWPRGKRGVVYLP